MQRRTLLVLLAVSLVAIGLWIWLQRSRGPQQPSVTEPATFEAAGEWDLATAAAPFREGTSIPPTTVFDRHGGVSETSNSMYLVPSLVDMDAAETATLNMPDHLERMVPDVVAGVETALRVFLAEGLKAEETGKGTASHEMSSTGVWGVRDLNEATAEQGRQETEDFVQAAVRFIERWNELRPLGTDE